MKNNRLPINNNSIPNMLWDFKNPRPYQIFVLGLAHTKIKSKSSVHYKMQRWFRKSFIAQITNEKVVSFVNACVNDILVEKSKGKLRSVKYIVFKDNHNQPVILHDFTKNKQKDPLEV
jgi:hypothetical protein